MSNFDAASFLEHEIKAIREELGREKALIAVSGGVDSTVSAIIAYKALGENLICVFIDDNFMRYLEPEKVKQTLSSPPLNLPVKILDCRRRFMSAIDGLSDAEEKRKAFRETFYKVLGETAKEEGCRYLIQGTIKADILETQRGIKTQHNVLEQIGIDPFKSFGLKIIEPLKTLYKYKVREVARFLGVPEEVSERQPFPGPGLLIRVVGLMTEEKLEEIKQVTRIVEENFEDYRADQYFAAIFSGEADDASEIIERAVADTFTIKGISLRTRVLHERGTGIIDGKRVYGAILAVEAVDKDGTPLDFSYDKLEEMRIKIQKASPKTTRILYLLDKKKSIGYVVALRAVKTRDFITANIVEMPLKVLKETSQRITKERPKVAAVYLDVTPKPPATIEFE
ncbi:GMP synthase [Candidatus Bathyarchaeota archaeon]|nr:GMP synthase [Candidatus Bathyarchaeota archaeon]MBS7630026.1 GMP synthase [Candidatus Bathyarchaeota archaeon]